jgi:hypothetical protein
LSEQLTLKARYQYLNLFRDEQYIKPMKVGGSFTPADPAVFAGFVDSSGQTLQSPKTSVVLLNPAFRGGPRHYVSVDLSYEFTPSIDLSLAYARGELAPSFQLVNKFSIGITLKYLGRQ